MKSQAFEKADAPAELIIPPGIKLNRGKKKESIGVSFPYNGKEVRETIRLSITQKNIDHVSQLRGEILNSIAVRGTYDHEGCFPTSQTTKRAQRARAEARAEFPTQITVEEMLRRHMLVAQKSVDLSSFNQYTSVCRKHLLPQWGNWNIRDITARHLRDWIRKFPQKKSTVDSILLPLRQAMALAYKDKIIPKNPFDNVDVRKLLTKTQVETEHLVVPFDIDEINRILSFCDSDQERRMFQFAFTTGTIPSEYIALQWSDVNLSRGKIRITSKHIDGQTTRRGKTGATIRQIDMREGARHALERQRPLYWSKSDLVFPNPRTGKQWTGDKQIRGRWHRILKNANVDYRNPFQTRQTYASILLMLGHNPVYIAGQLGYTTTAMIAKTYGKLNELRIEGEKRERLKAMYAETVQSTKS